MKHLIETHPNALACQDAAVRLACEAIEHGRKPVLIVPSYTHQIQTQVWLAQRNDGFGIGVTTPASWVEELWELIGSGEALVNGFLRILTIHQLLSAQTALPCTKGMLNLLNDCAYQALPFIGDASELSRTEGESLSLLASYREHIHARRLIEPCEACVRLAGAKALARFKPILLGFAEYDLSPAQRILFEGADASIIINDQSRAIAQGREAELVEASKALYRRTEGSTAVVSEGCVRLALASGPSASNRMVLDQIESALEDGCEDVVVATADPFGLFGFAAPILGAKGIGCRISASRKAEETDMGRALVALGQLTSNSSSDPRDADVLTAADFSFSPFSGIDRRSAFRISRLHRGNRLTIQDEILSDLASSASDDLAGLVALAEERNWPGVAKMLQGYLDRRFGTDPAYHSEQSRVLANLTDTWPLSQTLTLHGLMTLTGAVTIATNAETAESARVTFCTQASAASLGAGSVDCVLFAGLSAQENPIEPAENALQTLLAKMGAAPAVDPLSHARRIFYDAFQAASKRIVLQRPVNDAEGNPSQAATVFEELLDCYRPELRTEKGMVKALSIPESMLRFTDQAGEADVLENQGVPVCEMRECQLSAIGQISDASRDIVVLPHRYDAGLFDGPDVSPSQIESYLECPYSWFAKRRLKLEGIDEGFSPLERGTFMHEVLRRFYPAFQSHVQAKVTEDSLEQAEAIMEQAFRKVCELQPLERPGRRYVPISDWEEKERQSVLRKLKSYLATEAHLLPQFEPRYFEWEFAKERPFPYAGCNLRGCIDRIDVDGRGNAVVIDYKSSLSSSYRLTQRSEDALAPFTLPQKMQALIYAKVVRDVLGLNVVATLYVNPLKSQVLGAFDSTVLGPNDIPFASNADMMACSLPYGSLRSVSELIDLSENMVEEKLSHLAQGVIAPAPAHEGACETCPVNICEHRLCPRRL